MGVTGTILIYSLQLLVFHYHRIFIRVIGVEGQLSVGASYIILSLIYAFDTYTWVLYWMGWVLPIGAVITASTYARNFWPRYVEKPICFKNLAVVLSSYLFIAFLSSFGYMCTFETVFVKLISSLFLFAMACLPPLHLCFLFCCAQLQVVMSNRFNGTLVLYTLVKKKVKTLDLMFLFGGVLILLENLYFNNSPLKHWLVDGLGSSGMLPSVVSSDMLREIHVMPWVLILTSMSKSIYDLWRVIGNILEIDKKGIKKKVIITSEGYREVEE